MSTNPKELNAKKASESAIAASKRSVDRSIRALMLDMEHENTLKPETPLVSVQRVLKIYRGIKPLLMVVGAIPIIPSTWGAALSMFTKSLDALSVALPEVTAAFKAGKDL
jgi:hypothetical protein